MTAVLLYLPACQEVRGTTFASAAEPGLVTQGIRSNPWTVQNPRESDFVLKFEAAFAPTNTGRLLHFLVTVYFEIVGASQHEL